MRTFIFVQKNGSATLVLSAFTLTEAEDELDGLVLYPFDWRVENPEGEVEDD